MKTRLSNHSATLPTSEDLWLESVNNATNIRVSAAWLQSTLPNILKSKEDPTTKPHVRADFLTYWRIPKGTKSDLYHQDPTEEMIQCAIENSQRVVVEVGLKGADTISRLYRVGKKKTNDNDAKERVHWQHSYSIDTFSNEIMNTDDVLKICQHFMKRETPRLPEGYFLHELPEFALPLTTHSDK